MMPLRWGTMPDHETFLEAFRNLNPSGVWFLAEDPVIGTDTLDEDEAWVLLNAICGIDVHYGRISDRMHWALEQCHWDISDLEVHASFLMAELGFEWL